MGPHHEEIELLVDTAVERLSIKQLPTRLTIGKKTCDVLGVEGRPFKASVVEGVEIKGNSRKCNTDLLYLPKIDANLLGRDLQVKLEVGIVPKGGRMVVQMMAVTIEDLNEINSDVWAEEGKYGYLNITPIEVKMQEGTTPVRIKQYPILAVWWCIFLLP